METAAKTIKLYDDRPYDLSFTGEIIYAGPMKEGTRELVLDRTLFFPEEGGQSPDQGMLADCRVTDVQIRDGVIIHTVRGSRERLEVLEPGCPVRGELDWDFRFSNMQNHTGEHILSGLLHSTYGFDNIGFRLSPNTVTLDFNGHLDRDALLEIERRANEAVYANLEVIARYPDRDRLEAMEYRSKKQIDEAVRVVTIPGVDACACCAPHVRRTGEIGVIRILKSLRFKGGTRLTILSGRRALALMQQQLIVLEDVSHLTSRKQEELAEGVRSLLEENAAQRFRIGELERQVTDLRLSAIPADQKNVFLAEADMSPLAQRGYVNGLCERHEGCCGVFVGNDSEGYKFIIGARQSDAKHQNALHSDARQAAALLRETLGARGGGKPAMVQGSVKATWQEIQKALEGLSEI